MMSMVYGVGAGIVRAFFGWAKSGEKFDLEKFGKTLVIFALTGFVIGLYVSDPLQVFAMSFIGVPIEDFVKKVLK